MKKIEIMLYTIFMTIALTVADDAVSANDAATSIIELHRQVTEAMLVHGDPEPFLAATHPDFTVVAPGGKVETRKEVVAGLESIEADGISLSQEVVTFYGDTAVLTGRLEIDGIMKPVGDLGPMKFMAVFQRDNDHWQMLSRALTRCHPMAVQHGFC